MVVQRCASCGSELLAEYREAEKALWRLGRRIEGDPILQYKLHKIMARVWLAITLPLLALAIFFPHIWLVVGIAYVMVASNYANWATDNGAMSAANASTPENITPFAIEQAAAIIAAAAALAIETESH